MSDLDFFALASSISDCICTALTNRYVDDRVLSDQGVEIPWRGTCCVWPGADVAFDNCCEGGFQAWVVMKQAYPTVSFPTQDTTGTYHCNDGHSLAVVFEVGAIRCVGACIDCDCKAKETDANAVFKDLQALLRGLQCCFTADQGCGDKEWRLLSVTMEGPQGACAGSSVQIVVSQPMPCCATIEEGI